MESLQTMKYQELQKLAKKYGIKANMKIEKLRKALAEYYQKNGEILEKNDKNSTKSKPCTPVQKVTSLPKTKTPVQKVIGTSTCSQPSPRTATPILVQRALHKSNTPKAISPVSRKSSTVNTTPKIVKPVKTGTPKINTPVTGKTGTPKSMTPGQIEKKVSKTPKSDVRATITQAVDKKTVPSGITNKRKHSETVTPKTQEEDGRKAKRRRSTFEVATPPMEKLTPQTDEGSGTRKRRSTFEVTPEIKISTDNQSKEAVSSDKTKRTRNKKSVSPGVQEIITSMDTDKGEEGMKKDLLNALDKKVKNAKTNEISTDKKPGVTQIPRFAAFLAKKKEEEANKKTVTPGNKDWTKIHKRQFDKMESIEDYLKKRKQQREDVTTSVKKARQMLEETKAAVNKLKNYKTPVNEKNKVKSLFKTPSDASRQPFKPTVLSTKNMDLNFSKPRTSPRTSCGSVQKPFKPSVMSTSNMNLNFGNMKTPQTVPRKASLPNSNHSAIRKSVGSSVPRKSTGVTPFRFNATLNNTLNETKSAKKFDLKASLSRPVTWKMHTGALKPVEKISSYLGPVDVENKKQIAKSPIQRNRDQRRAAAQKQRKDKKWQNQMNKRGIKV